jgi:hypothetical protein
VVQYYCMAGPLKPTWLRWPAQSCRFNRWTRIMLIKSKSGLGDEHEDGVCRAIFRPIPAVVRGVWIAKGGCAKEPRAATGRHGESRRMRWKGLERGKKAVGPNMDSHRRRDLLQCSLAACVLKSHTRLDRLAWREAILKNGS